ncbi:MAG: hypothetical protein ACI9JK_001337, partial [Phycisphaerales bacterium]
MTGVVKQACYALIFTKTPAGTMSRFNASI